MQNYGESLFFITSSSLFLSSPFIFLYLYIYIYIFILVLIVYSFAFVIGLGVKDLAPRMLFSKVIPRM